MATPDISIITPWRDHPELIPDYEAAVRGAEVVVVDNNSDPANAVQIRDMVERLDGIYLRNWENWWFSAACNQGLAVARGRVLLCLNNDVYIEPAFLGWLPWLKWVTDKAGHIDTEDGDQALVGPSLATYELAGHKVPYIEGWCIAAHRDTWAKLGGWDATAYPMPYWEDVDLCFRARHLGIRLDGQPDWPIRHKGNVTTKTTPGAEAAFHANHATLEERVKRAYAI